MPSKQFGSVAIAAAFALLAIFLYFARDDQGAWRTALFKMNPKKDSELALVKSSPTMKAVQTTGDTSSKADQPEDITDPATDVEVPRKRRFEKSEFWCLGVGVRAKSIAIAKVNVYSVAMYVEPRAGKSALKAYAGKDPAKLKNDKSLFKILGQPGGFNKYLHLVFVRTVKAKKVVEALTEVKGVSEDVLSKFSEMTLNSIGGSLGKDDTFSLGWEGKDKLIVMVRNKAVGTIVDAALPKAIFDLYLGSSPVAPAAKTAFAEGVPSFLEA